MFCCPVGQPSWPLWTFQLSSGAKLVSELGFKPKAANLRHECVIANCFCGTKRTVCLARYGVLNMISQVVGLGQDPDMVAKVSDETKKQTVLP